MKSRRMPDIDLLCLAMADTGKSFKLKKTTIYICLHLYLYLWYVFVLRNSQTLACCALQLRCTMLDTGKSSKPSNELFLLVFVFVFFVCICICICINILSKIGMLCVAGAQWLTLASHPNQTMFSKKPWWSILFAPISLNLSPWWAIFHYTREKKFEQYEK